MAEESYNVAGNLVRPSEVTRDKLFTRAREIHAKQHDINTSNYNPVAEQKLSLALSVHLVLVFVDFRAFPENIYSSLRKGIWKLSVSKDIAIRKLKNLQAVSTSGSP